MRTMDRFDLIVVGAGPAGLSAASVVSRLGGRVLVLDESPRAGGRLPGQAHPELTFSRRPKWTSGAVKAQELLENATAAGVRILCGVSVWGLSPGWIVGTTPAVPCRNGRKVSSGFQAKAVLIATGASQNPLVFKDWTLPGVITAGAAQTLINVHRVRPGSHAAVVGIDPLSISVAWLMAACGVDVKGIILPPDGYMPVSSSPRAVIKDLARAAGCLPSTGFKLAGRLLAQLSPFAANVFPCRGIRINGCRLMMRRKAECVGGDRRVEEIRVVALNASGEPVAGSEAIWQVDVVITSAGLHPLTELAQAAGCPLIYSAPLGGWVPLHSARMETPLPGLFIAGSITGVEGARVAEAQGRLAGFRIAQHLKLAEGHTISRELESAAGGVRQARASSFPFFPDVNLGRAQLAAAWDASAGSRYRSNE